MNKELGRILEAKHARLAFTEVAETAAAIAFCSTCRRLIYNGTYDNFISCRVMDMQIQSHIMAYSDRHSVEVIYPRLPEDGTRA